MIYSSLLNTSKTAPGNRTFSHSHSNKFQNRVLSNWTGLFIFFYKWHPSENELPCIPINLTHCRSFDWEVKQYLRQLLSTYTMYTGLIVKGKNTRSLPVMCCSWQENRAAHLWNNMSCRKLESGSCLCSAVSVWTPVMKHTRKHSERTH